MIVATARAPSKRIGSQISAASATMESPSDQKTNKKTGYSGDHEKVYARRITVTSSSISQRPRVTRKRARSLRLLPLCHQNQAPRRAVRAKAGAQTWVIHRVMNNTGVVVVRSVGDCVIALWWTKSRT